MSTVLEFEQEPIKGIPGLLPASEEILWRGAPTWRSLMMHVFHIRWVWAYFAAIMAWRAYSHIASGNGLEVAASSAAWLGFLGLLVTALIAGTALQMKRTTVYTITSKRVILRFGLVVPIAINVPFAKIESAGVERFGDGSGDLPMALGGPDQFVYWMLWPHVRRWSFFDPKPMIRSVPDAAMVAGILANAIERSLPAGEAAQARHVTAPVNPARPSLAGDGMPQPA